MPKRRVRALQEQVVSFAGGALIAALCVGAPATAATTEFRLSLFGPGGTESVGSILADPGQADGSAKLATSKTAVEINFGGSKFSQAMAETDFWQFDEDRNFLFGATGVIGFGDGLGNVLKLTGIDAESWTFSVTWTSKPAESGTFEINTVREKPPGDYDAQGGGGLPVVPLPGTLPLLVAGVGAIGLLRRARRG